MVRAKAARRIRFVFLGLSDNPSVFPGQSSARLPPCPLGCRPGNGVVGSGDRHAPEGRKAICHRISRGRPPMPYTGRCCGSVAVGWAPTSTGCPHRSSLPSAVGRGAGTRSCRPRPSRRGTSTSWSPPAAAHAGAGAVHGGTCRIVAAYHRRSSRLRRVSEAHHTERARWFGRRHGDAHGVAAIPAASAERIRAVSEPRQPGGT